MKISAVATMKSKARKTTPKTKTTRKSGPRAKPAERELLRCRTARDWHAWLSKHHASSTGVWLRIAKKGSKERTLTYAEALEGALIWGWIDAQKDRLDSEAWLQRFTPRRKTSIWSQINRDKALALINEGKMQPPGLAAVESAKRDGRFASAYASQSRATVPVDLRRALDDAPRAKAFFSTLDSRNRYAILFRLGSAKKPETRAARLERFVQMLERGDKLHP